MARKPGTVAKAARAYIQRGWKVFPLAPALKIPEKGSAGFKDASGDINVIQQWFGLRDDLNIGIATGESGLVVVDIDPKDGGDSSYKEWSESHGVFPRTVVAQTGGGGKHYYFKLPEGMDVPCRAPWTPTLLGIDIRARGGYVAAPGSVHPITGREYRWEPGNSPVDVEVAELSGSALEFVQTFLNGAVDAPMVHRDPTFNYETPGLPEIVNDGEGRERTLVALAGRLRRTGLDQNAIMAALDDYNQNHIRPPKSDRDIKRIAKSVSRYAPDIDEVLRLRHEAKHPAEEYKKPEFSEEEIPEESKLDFLIEPHRAWAARADDEIPEIIPGILHASALSILASPPKTGKTWMVYDLMISVATGTPFMSRYMPVKTGKVLYIATEGIHADSRDRIRALALGKGIETPDDIPNMDFIWRQNVQLDETDFTDLMDRVGSNYVLIIVDVLADAWSGEENQAVAVSDLMKRIRSFIGQSGPTFLLLHHTVKPSQENGTRRAGFNVRGSGAFYGAIDDGIYLTPTEDRCRSKVKLETRAGAPGDPEEWEFSWPEETVDGSKAISLVWSAKQDEVDEAAAAMRTVMRIIEARPDGTRHQDIKNSCDLPGQLISATLSDLVNRRMIDRIEGMNDKGTRPVAIFYPHVTANVI